MTRQLPTIERYRTEQHATKVIAKAGLHNGHLLCASISSGMGQTEHGIPPPSPSTPSTNDTSKS